MKLLVWILAVCCALIGGSESATPTTIPPGCRPFRALVNHTMCVFKPTACSTGYTLIKTEPLTRVQRDEVVNLHNTLRKQLVDGKVTGQPKAKTMQRFSWDNTLATIAQRAAEQCNFNHDQNRDVGKNPNQMVGQNIHQVTLSPVDETNNKPNFTMATLDWWNEVFDPGFKGTIKPFNGSEGTGHYTQIAWAATNKIGCGFAVYKDADKMYKDIFCNYKVAGNLDGGTMYQVATNKKR